MTNIFNEIKELESRIEEIYQTAIDNAPYKVGQLVKVDTQKGVYIAYIGYVSVSSSGYHYTFKAANKLLEKTGETIFVSSGEYTVTIPTEQEIQDTLTLLPELEPYKRMAKLFEDFMSNNAKQYDNGMGTVINYVLLDDVLLFSNFISEMAEKK